MSFKWRVAPTRGYNARRYLTVLDRAVELELLSWAPRIEADAKRNAPWTDRTSNARQTLAAFVVRVPRHGGVAAQFVTRGERVADTQYRPGIGGWALVFRQGMSYGVDLELNYGGKFAIVGPMLEHYTTPVWSGVKGLMTG